MVARRFQRGRAQRGPSPIKLTDQFRHARRRSPPAWGRRGEIAVPASARRFHGVRSGALNAGDLTRVPGKATCPGRRRPRARARRPAPRLRGPPGRGRHSTVARPGGPSAAAEAAARLSPGTTSRRDAQALLRHVAARLRPHAGAPARRLRRLRGAARPHAVRRSLPCHRQGARAPLQPMQSRHRPAQGQPGPIAQGRRLCRGCAERFA